jgi:hypothetical protein
VSCVIDRRSTTGFAWQLSLYLFCFNAVKENHSVGRAIDKTLRNVCYFLIDSHKNYVSIFINRPAGNGIPDCCNTCCLAICLQQFNTAPIFNYVSQGANSQVYCLLGCDATQFSTKVLEDSVVFIFYAEDGRRIATCIPGNLASKRRKHASVSVFPCAIASIFGNQTTSTKVHKLLFIFLFFIYRPLIKIFLSTPQRRIGG